MENELDKFFQDVHEDAPVIDTSEQKPEVQEVQEDEPKNRQERRIARNATLREQLAEMERKAIAAEARAEALMTSRGSNGEVDERLLRLYGDNENGKLAAQLTQEILDEKMSKAEERAYERFMKYQADAEAEQRREEQFIDSQLEDLEDDYNIDITSNSPAARKTRQELLELVEKLSPKDENGEILQYADFKSTFDLYQTTRSSRSERSRELAGRSMQKSAPPSQTTLNKEEDDRNRSWLRRNGIRV